MALVSFSFASLVQASPSAIPTPATAIQPDGMEIEVVLKGNAERSWYETREGYLVTKDGQSQWVYAKVAKSNAKSLSRAWAMPETWLIEPTGSLVGRDEPTEANIVPKGFGQKESAHNHSMHKAVSGSNPIASKLGVVPMLVIMGYYDDALSAAGCTSCATTDPDYIQQLFFADGAQQTSVADFFSSASKGAFTMTPAQETYNGENDGVVGWLRLGAQTPEATVMSTSSYKSNRIAADAINAAMAYVDFTQYDQDRNGRVTADELGITVILGGYEASYGRDEDGRSLADNNSSPRVWGQSRTFVTSFSGVGVPTQSKNGRTVQINTSNDGMTYSIVGELHGNHPVTMGIITHEIGHTIFDLPDLYDTRGSSNGVGGWSLMGYGSWGKTRNDSYPGSTPVMMGAWSRLALGWVTPEVPVSGDVSNLSAEAMDVAILATANTNEYFLVENRQNQGYDKGLYYFLYTENFGGLAVWHIDDSMGSQGLNNDNGNVFRKRVDLVAAQFDDRLDDGSSYGHANNLYNANNVSALSDQTHDNMALYSGDASGITINQVSFADVSMSYTALYNGENVSQLTSTTIGNSLTADLNQEANSSGGGGGGSASLWWLVFIMLYGFRSRRKL